MTDGRRRRERGWRASGGFHCTSESIDETPIYANEAPKRGRSRKGERESTLHLYAKRDGVLHWDLSGKNADTTEVERVAADAAGTMESGDTLIWDRLGRSGRSQHPTAQHYSPNAKATFEERGVTIKFLPPKGKYFNPLELLFNDLKTHYIRPKFRKNGVPLSKSEIEELVRAYVEEKAPATLCGFFRARANGADALKKQIL